MIIFNHWTTLKNLDSSLYTPSCMNHSEVISYQSDLKSNKIIRIKIKLRQLIFHKFITSSWKWKVKKIRDQICFYFQAHHQFVLNNLFEMHIELFLFLLLITELFILEIFSTTKKIDSWIVHWRRFNSLWDNGKVHWLVSDSYMILTGCVLT